MSKQKFLIPKSKIEIIKDWLLENAGIPSVVRDLAVYFKKNTGEEIHVHFHDRKCTLKYVKPSLDDIESPIIAVDTNYEIKPLLHFLSEIDFKNCSIGEILTYRFRLQNLVDIDLSIGTFIGTILTIANYKIPTAINPFLSLLNSMGIEKVGNNDIKKLSKKVQLQDELAINKIGILNERILNYCHKTGLEIHLPEKTLSSRVCNFDNDYSNFEDAYKFILGYDLLSTNSYIKSKLLNPISIIIPCYNSNSTFTKTLTSIDSQNIPEKDMEMIEVILIDDGSDIPIQKTLASHNIKLKYPVKIIRAEKNSGLSSARNIGISQAKYDTLIFLDSDVVISSNFLLEHSIRNILIPNAIFVSFKQNIDPEDNILLTSNITKGLPIPDISQDLRVKKIIKPNSLGLYSIKEELVTEILGDTNYFKEMSYGRNLGLYDLPSMVIGHNMSCRRENVVKVNGFSTEFHGWGIEDSFFGAKMVAAGNFVIPVLSCGVYHINHPPRSGNNSKKKDELKMNLKIYKKLMDLPFSHINQDSVKFF